MPDYDFRSLSPIDFEALARDLLNADLGLRLVSFAVGPDGGIDLRDMSENRLIVAQCKHRPDAKKNALIASATKEAERWKKEKPNMYYFVVSAAVSPDAEKEILKALGSLTVDSTSFWHHGSLNAALSRQPQIEKDHFKLWLSSASVLEKIIEASQWQRSEELLQRVSERVKLYVNTTAYAQALKILEKERVVIISGAPGVGKSTIAEMMLLSLWHQGWTISNIASDVDDAWTKFRSKDEKVVFYYDDFFGQTNVAEMQKNEASGIQLLMDRVRASNGNKLLIMTSREQILRQITSGNDDRARRVAEDPAKFRIELERMSRVTKAEMLFNHLHFGFSDERSRIQLAADTRYKSIIDHKNFNPRVLESVVLRQKHSSIDSFYENLIYALEHPDTIWSGSFNQLSQTAVQILLQLATHPTDYILLEKIRVSVNPEDPREWTSSLKVLENTWVRLIAGGTFMGNGAVNRISLFDPSRRDYLLGLLNEPAYFDAALEKMSSIQQINYLLRLSGLLDNSSIDEVSNKNSFSAFFVRKSDVFDEMCYKLAKKDVRSAKKYEQSVKLEHANNYPNFEPDWMHYAQGLEQRVAVLADIAVAISVPTLPTPRTENYFHKQLGELSSLIDYSTVVEASELLSLTKALISVQDCKYCEKEAVDIANAAVDRIFDIDELKAYFELPDWFRAKYMQGWAFERVKEAFESELDSIRRQDNADIMAQQLRELNKIGIENGVQVDAGDLYDKIEHMRTKNVNQKLDINSKRANTSAAVGSDEDLQVLFSKLI